MKKAIKIMAITLAIFAMNSCIVCKKPLVEPSTEQEEAIDRPITDLEYQR